MYIRQNRRTKIYRVSMGRNLGEDGLYVIGIVLIQAGSCML